MTTYASVCSGIEAMSVAVRPLGWSPMWQYRVAQTVTCTDLHCVITPDGVRRLMPVEEERLFGFPDNYTAITYKGHPASPYARHHALGNSWAVPCARWICERINRSVCGALS